MKLYSIGVLSLLLCGCASTAMDYQAKTSENPWGYEERVQEDGSYILSVSLPGLLSKGSSTLPFEYWERRAAELCGNGQYEKNIYKARRETLNTQGAYVYGGVGTGGGSPGAFTLEGKLTCSTESK